MKDRSLFKLGGICSILVGLSYVMIGITELLLPPEFTAENNARMPIMFFEANQTLFLTQYWAMALGAVFALAVIPAVNEKVRYFNEGWVRWTGTLATLGFAATIIDNYWAIAMTPAIATAYLTGGEIARTALGLPTGPQVLDAKGWLQYGAVGVWVLVISILALRSKVWPRLLSYLGVAVAIAYFLVLATIIFPAISGMILVLAGIGGIILGPLWYIWMGIILYRNHPLTAGVQKIEPQVIVNE